MKRALLVVLALGVVMLCAGAAILWWSGDRVRTALVGAVSDAIGLDIDLTALELGIAPLRVSLVELSVGRPRLFAIERGTAQLHLGESLRHRRLFVALEVDGVRVDLAAVPGGEEAAVQEDGAADAPPLLPPAELTLHVHDAEIALDGARAIALAEMAATVSVAAFDSVRLQLAAGGIELSDAERRTALGELRGAVTWQAAQLAIEDLAMKGGVLELAARPRPGDVAEETLPTIAPIAVDLRGEVGAVVDFIAGEAVGITAGIEAALSVDGELVDPNVAGSLRLDRPDLAGVRFAEIESAVSRRRGVIRIANTEARWPGGVLVAEAALTEADLELRGEVGWRDVDTAALMDAAEDWRSHSTGDAVITGPLDPLQLSVDGRGVVAAEGIEPLPFQFALTTDGAGVSGEVDVRIDADNHVRLDLERLDDTVVAGRLNVAIASLERVAAALGYAGRLPLGGGVTAAAVLSGSGSDAQAAVEVALANGRLADGSLLEFAARFDVSQRHCVVDSLHLRAGGGELTAAGAVSLASGAANDWQVRGAGVDVAPLVRSLRESVMPDLPEIAGILDISGSAAGDWDALQAEVDLGVGGAAVDAIELGDIALRGGVSNGRWRTNLEGGGGSSSGRLSLQARGAGATVEALAGTVEKWPLALLAAGSEVAIGGSISGRADVTATAGGVRGTVALAVDDLSIADQALGNSTVSAAADGGPWQVDGRLLDEVFVLEGQVGNGAGWPLSARLHWDAADLPAGIAPSEDMRITSSGDLRASGSLADPTSVAASLVVARLEIASGARQLSNPRPIRIEYAAGGLRLESFELAGDRTRLSASGEASPGALSSARVDGTVALSWLEHFVPGVDAAGGMADIEVEIVTRPGGAPELAGAISLRDGLFEFDGAPPITGLRGEIALASSRITIQSLHGDIGGGRFALVGTVDLEDGPGLDWTLQNVSFEPTHRLEMVLSGNGSVSGSWARTTLAGELVIGDLLYDRNVDFQDLIPSFDRAVRPPPRRRSERPPLRLDLRVSARDSLYVENNLANLEARTDLRITGNVENPRLRGAIEIIDGRILLRGRSFEVVNGALTFKPDLPGQATIDFTAESIIESRDVPYSVEVRVSGTTDDFRVVLTSEDGLSQTDILSLIAFGRTVAEIQEGGGAGGGMSMDTVASIAGGQVGQALAGEVRDVLPFDEVEIRPGFSPTTGEFEPQIRVGKFLTEDLSAWVAQTFGVRSQTAVEASYALTRQIAMILRWESQAASQEGAFGGEISQRFQFWRKPTWLRWGSPAGEEAPE